MAAEILDDAHFFLPSDILSDDFPDDFPYDHQPFSNDDVLTCNKLPSTVAWASSHLRLHPQPPTVEDMLFASTGQVMSISHGDVDVRQNTLHHAMPSHKPTQHSVSNGYRSSPTANTHHRQLQVHQFNHLKRQQMLKQQQNRSRGGLFQETSADMRALFLATPSSRKQSYGGTGVFFPRRVGCSIDSNKKSACSTVQSVLLPARVVQALNLNLDSLDHFNQRNHGGFMLDHDTVIARSGGIFSHENERGFVGGLQRSLAPVTFPNSVNHHLSNTY
ncbi:hypothetical protein ZOSMA_93G00320 [Zostera marina]|uniref:Uncharacterized protein n=1 Tax=Zostera marina TaxID=29655 RepID=A0A0K9NIW6_ZOSMR|nr:hypothetical protein ZOSMA_93G00320 [Zostera marina]